MLQGELKVLVHLYKNSAAKVGSSIHKKLQMAHTHGVTFKAYFMDVQAFYGKGVHLLLWVAHRKMTIST
jgi:hypothetical protein